jgi:predicted transcriptional regulator
MIASQLINEHLSPLRTTDSVEAALAFMISQGVTELPLIEQKQLYNYVRLHQLSGLNKEQTLGDAIAKNHFTPSARGNSHLYELVPMLAANELGLLAVTDEEGNYQGIIEQKSINKLISDSFTYRGMGAILVLLMDDRDFAPSQLARWIEENGAKMLGMMINHAEQGKLRINIKLNTTVVRGILATLDRQHIAVEHVFMAEDHDENDTKAFDVVFKFFDI